LADHLSSSDRNVSGSCHVLADASAASHHSSWQGAKLKQLEMQRVIDDRATDGMFAKSSIGRMSAS
jgi:hypothetical protein